MRAHDESACECCRCEGVRRGWYLSAKPAPIIPLCPACIGSIGGAHGGPDAPHRPASKGEPCGAAECRGTPWPGDDDEGPDDPALDIEEGDGRTPRERLGLGGGE